VLGHHRADAEAVLERAQLLERFGELERGLRQRREAQQEVAPDLQTARAE